LQAHGPSNWRWRQHLPGIAALLLLLLLLVLLLLLLLLLGSQLPGLLCMLLS
jgi:hypothetical protein